MGNIEPLIEKYLEIVDSARNLHNRRYWDNTDEPYLAERWRGRSLRRTGAPFTMALDIAGYSRVLGFNCIDYYSSAEAQLTYQLRYAAWEFENQLCHRYFDKTVFISFGSVLEASFFGVPYVLLPGQAPWYDEKDHVLKRKSDLLRIPALDFHTTGLCGRIHRFYEEMNRLTRGYPLKVMFPVTLRSPFSIALMLRGYANLLMDTVDDPPFFHDLMSLIANRLKQYAVERSKFLGEPVPRFKLFNDEIGLPVVSRRLYEEMIFPYERDLAQFAGGINYWHSCGNTSELYESVAGLPGLQMMHIGPWSDIDRAAEVFGRKDIPIEICLNSVADVYERNADEMRMKLRGIRSACDGRVRYQVRADGFSISGSIESALEKIRQWNRTASDVFPGDSE